MTEKNEALRLADVLEMSRNRFRREAAAELRRLSAENDALGMHLLERVHALFKVEAQRDALLEALKGIVAMWDHHCYAHGDGQPTPLHVKARAAIAKAEGNT